MPPSSLEHLHHILDEAQYLISTSKGLNRDDCLMDETLKRAFVRSIEIIGEASKKVSPQLKERHNELEWRAIEGMRDRLVHDYLGVDYDIVWDVVLNKVPFLCKKVESIIQEETLSGDG
jgi:uncharacterized protein with HEPN domain